MKICLCPLFQTKNYFPDKLSSQAFFIFSTIHTHNSAKMKYNTVPVFALVAVCQTRIKLLIFSWIVLDKTSKHKQQSKTPQ